MLATVHKILGTPERRAEVSLMTGAPAALLDRLAARGLRVVLRNNRLWILPAKAFAVLLEADRAAIREHRAAIKDLVRNGYAPVPAPDPSRPRAPAPEPESDARPRLSVGGQEISEADVLTALRLEGDEALDDYAAGRLSRSDAYQRARCRARQAEQLRCGPARWSRHQ